MSKIDNRFLELDYTADYVVSSSNYSGILSGKPYYTNGNFRIIWDTGNFRWEIQDTSGGGVRYYNDSLIDLSKPYYQQNWQTSGASAPTPVLLESDKLYTIKNVDHIIDDDNESIDGSDTPMVDSHRELVTRAYTDSLFASNAHWNKVSNVLTPADPNVEAIEWERNFNGYTRCTMKNTDDTGNGAGAIIELKGSGANYTNNIYIGKYGNSFWLPFLAGNGAVMTDKNLVVGTVTDGQEYRIVTGGGYTDPTQIAYFDQNGLHIISNKAASHPNIFVEEMKVASGHSASHLSVFVDTASGQLYSEAVPTYTPLTQTTEKFTVTATDVANGYIDLTNTPNATEHLFVYLNGVYMDLDSAGDYTLSSNRINFIVNIEVDDKVIVKYSY